MPEPLPRLDPTTLPEPVDIADNRAALADVRAVIDAGPFNDTWESLRAYKPPLWYVDAKFGIFVHWGLYSVPAFRNEWYPRYMYREGTDYYEHHISTYGPQREFGYKDFIPSFTMKRFDPDMWVALFRRAGAQFVMPVAEHHDGFALYDTDRSRWSSTRLGPRRDIVGDLLDATDRAWMVRAASSHRAEHWYFLCGGQDFDSDVRDPAYYDFYGPAQRAETGPNQAFLEDWLLRTIEIIDKYRPQVLWFDFWIEHPAFEPYLRMLASYYYNRAAAWGREVVINYKWDAFKEGTAVYDIERGTAGGIRPVVWQNDTAVQRTAWGWIEGHDYKSVREVLAELADTVSKNGVLLLNVGPKPDGTIPQEEQRILEEIGDWLARNGEAIYGTRPWVIPAEGSGRFETGSFVHGEAPRVFGSGDVRFTTRAWATREYLYAILLAHPEDGIARIRSLGSAAGLLDREIRAVHQLGPRREATWTQTPHALEVTLDGDPEPHGGPVIRLQLAPRNEPERPEIVFD